MISLPSPTFTVAGKYLCINREWANGDRVELTLPMSLSMRTWQVNKNSVSVDYGPLTLSLKIAEKYVEKDSRETAIGDSKWQKGADPQKWPTTDTHSRSTSFAKKDCGPAISVAPGAQ